MVKRIDESAIASDSGDAERINGIETVNPADFGTSDGGGGDSSGDGGERIKRKYTRRTAAELAAARGGEFHERVGDDGVRGKPGRKPKEAQTEAITAERIAPFIMMFHMTAAARFPEMAMQQAEADQLAAAIAGYMKHTKVRVNPKTQALFTLLGTAAVIEGTRVMAIGRRKAAEVSSKKRPPSGVVLMDEPVPGYEMPTGYGPN